MPTQVDAQNPLDDMRPRHTSACCNVCPWTAETVGISVLPLVKAHADEHRHTVTAHAWTDDAAPCIVAACAVPPDADLIRRFASKPDPSRLLVVDEYFDLVADSIRDSDEDAQTERR